MTWVDAGDIRRHPDQLDAHDFAFPPPLPGGYDPGMDGQQKSRGGPLYWLGRRSRRFWIIAVMLMPVLYVASFGPACWLAERHMLPRKHVAMIYEPLVERGIQNRSTFEKSLLWYATVLGKKRYSPYATNILFDLKDELFWSRRNGR